MPRLCAPFVALLLTSIPSLVSAQDIPADFVIRLERPDECQVECPRYSVTIDAQGNVTYDGVSTVRVSGRAVDRIPLSQVRRLHQAVERIGFFKLLDRYHEVQLGGGRSVTVTERQTVFVSATRNGETKRIEDYFGAPPDLRELERQIDDVANTRRWIRIDEATLRQLVAEGRPPSPEQRAEFLKLAVYADELDVVTTLLQLGDDPNGPNDEEHTPVLFRVRSAAAVRTLLDAGADPLVRTAHGQTPLGRAIYQSPDVTEALLKAGVPADFQVDLDGTTALLHAARIGNVGVVRLLLAAGANPYRRDLDGTAADAARRGKEYKKKNQLLPDSVRELRYVEDFDATIAALEQAMSKKSGR